MSRDAKASWRFALRPRWILGHLIIVACVVLFANMALWQHHRHDQRVAHNAEIRSRMAQDPIVIGQLSDLKDLPEYRNVILNGRLDFTKTVYQRYPILDGLVGYYALTPLVLHDGSAVIVNEGFVERDTVDSNRFVRAGQSLPSAFQGYVRDFEPTAKVPGTTKSQPPSPTVGGADLEDLTKLDQPYVLGAKWMQLKTLADGTTVDGELKTLPEPDLGEGPHNSYMLQWIAFAILAVVGWSAVLWRTASEEGEREKG